MLLFQCIRQTTCLSHRPLIQRLKAVQHRRVSKKQYGPGGLSDHHSRIGIQQQALQTTPETALLIMLSFQATELLTMAPYIIEAAAKGFNMWAVG